MKYVWDRRKSRVNLARHGIAFEDAIRIFNGPTLEKVDDRFDYGEIRVYAIGVVNRFDRKRTPDHFGMESGTT